MTQYTENYRLELYEGTDKADLTDQYNVSMGILDGAMKGVVDDTDASVAGIRADLATTNSNLNATNINLTALDQKVDSNQTAQAATNLNFQNEIDTLKTTVDAVPGTYATQEALAALKTEVDKNTPLVEEHGNYFAQLGVTDEESAMALHTEIDNAFQGTMSNTTAIEEMRAQLSPWKFIGTSVFSKSPINVTYNVYHQNGLCWFDVLSTEGYFTGEKNISATLPLPAGYELRLSNGLVASNVIWPFDGDKRLRVSVAITSSTMIMGITNGYIGEFQPSKNVFPSFAVPVQKTTEPPSGGDNPEPPQEPLTFGAYPDLSSANGGVGTTNAKFSGSVDEAGKLVMSNVNAFYNFTSALGSGEVSLPTRKIVIANIASSDVVQVPTSVRVYSATLSGSQTYPVSYANGELSFTPTADNNSLGSHTGAASSKTLILSAYYSYDTAPNPPAPNPPVDPNPPSPTIAWGQPPKCTTSNNPMLFGYNGTVTYSGEAKTMDGHRALTVNDLNVTYQPSYVVGPSEVRFNTGKHVVATINNYTPVLYPETLTVSSDSLNGQGQFPLTLKDGVLSFEVDEDNWRIGDYTGDPMAIKPLTLRFTF